MYLVPDIVVWSAPERTERRSPSKECSVPRRSRWSTEASDKVDYWYELSLLSVVRKYSQ
jgi:hypothetical protein